MGKLAQSRARRKQAERAFAAARTLIHELGSGIPADDLREEFVSKALALLPRAPLPTARQGAKAAFDGLTARERETVMEQSAPVREALLKFYERFSAGNVDDFARSIASWPDAFVIDTGPTEWQDGRATWIAGYEMQITAMPGIRIEAGSIRAYAEGPLGFAADQPNFILPNGLTIPTRMTAVLRQEGDTWKLLNVHFSAGVPDEVLIGLVRDSTSQQAAH